MLIASLVHCRARREQLKNKGEVKPEEAAAPSFAEAIAKEYER